MFANVYCRLLFIAEQISKFIFAIECADTRIWQRPFVLFGIKALDDLMRITSNSRLSFHNNNKYEINNIQVLRDNYAVLLHGINCQAKDVQDMARQTNMHS